jgi:hypothetical protein
VLEKISKKKNEIKYQSIKKLKGEARKKLLKEESELFLIKDKF